MCKREFLIGMGRKVTGVLQVWQQEVINFDLDNVILSHVLSLRFQKQVFIGVQKKFSVASSFGLRKGITPFIKRHSTTRSA